MLSLLVCVALAAPPGPADLIKDHYARIQALLEKGAPPDAVAAGVGAALDALVDFPELGRLTMAQHWPALSPRDRARFLVAFTALVKRQFAARVLSGRDLKLQVGGEEKRGESLHVSTTLTGRKSTTEIDFVFGKAAGAWKVFDLRIDGIEQARSWGRSFDRAMRRGGLDEVLARMARKR